MEAMQIQVTDHPAETDWQWLEGTINQFNMHLTGYQDYRPLAIFVRDGDGAIIAGLTAYTWGGTLRILVLWVHENWRRYGHVQSQRPSGRAGKNVPVRSRTRRERSIENSAGFCQMLSTSGHKFAPSFAALVQPLTSHGLDAYLGHQFVGEGHLN